MFNKIITILFILFTLLSQSNAAVSNTSISIEKIISVCEVHKITVTNENESIGYCPALPDRSGDPVNPRPFFQDIGNKQSWEKKCEDQSSNEPEVRDPSSFQKSFEGLQNGLNAIQGGINSLISFLIEIGMDVTRFSLVTKQWNWFLFLPTAIFMFLLIFCVQTYIVQNNNKVIINASVSFIMGITMTAVAYIAFLYFSNIYVWIFLWIFTFFTWSPLYPKTPFIGLGILTIILLLVPLIGVVTYSIFKTVLFFGPVITIVINTCSILLGLLCLLGFYLSEKFNIVRTLFLPILESTKKLVDKTAQNQEAVDVKRRQNENMARNLLTSFQYSEPLDMTFPQKLDMELTRAMRTYCNSSLAKMTNKAPEYKCHNFFMWQCFAGAYSIGSGAFFLSVFICPAIVPKFCANVDDKASNLCNKQIRDTSAFTYLFGKMGKTLEEIRNEIVIHPMIEPKKTFLDDLGSFNLWTANWTWWLRMIIQYVSVSFVTGMLIVPVLRAFPYLTAYKSNNEFNNNYLSKEYIEMKGDNLKLSRKHKKKYVTQAKKAITDYIIYMWNHKPQLFQLLKPLFTALVAFAIDRASKFLYEMLSQIDFVVPEYSEARLTFAIEGDSLLASLIKTVLGAFDFHSKYCTIADSKECAIGFRETEWPVWVQLLVLWVFFFFCEIFKTKSNYILCIVLDFLLPERARDRGEHLLKKIKDEQDQISKIKVQAARRRFKEINPVYSQGVDNQKVIDYYRNCRWCVTFLPRILASFIGWTKGANFIFCQWCGNDPVSYTFPCKKFLICEDCAFYVKHCECSSNICKRDPSDDRPYNDDPDHLPRKLAV